MTSRTFLMLGIPVGMLIAWFLFSPLFIDQQVEESLPGSESRETVQTSVDDLAARAAEMADIMASAAAKPDAAVIESMPEDMHAASPPKLCQQWNLRPF